MKILAFDSTAKTASVAVAENKQILAEFTVDSGMTQSELLLPMARQALTAAHLSFADIELFALTTGPGSFTGVRIGAALVKGLAFGKDIPCAPVSVMEALAENLLPLDGIYCPVTDARRAHVYNALFCEKDGVLTRLCDDRLIAITDLVAELAEAYPNTPIRLAGDATETVMRAGNERGLVLPPTPPALRKPSAAAVARCGLAIAKRGETVNDAALAPVYLFPSQAERDRLEKEQANNTKKEI
ncbi:MAG: tRNA (adenosine(37)-N6)-threonylcarbamoyltransferase complex dimerization subunit type 1 TsaB [Clostridia bacterium]|nr:tRNA (adenosine(37)-N6)-threonylcarbamoyltransferase complex dimerization subunit type 1 TsaB [Clostridia bacterium]